MSEEENYIMANRYKTKQIWNNIYEMKKTRLNGKRISSKSRILELFHKHRDTIESEIIRQNVNADTALGAIATQVILKKEKLDISRDDKPDIPQNVRTEMKKSILQDNIHTAESIEKFATSSEEYNLAEQVKEDVVSPAVEKPFTGRKQKYYEQLSKQLTVAVDKQEYHKQQALMHKKETTAYRNEVIALNKMITIMHKSTF